MNQENNRKPGLREVVGSMLAAALGVQSHRNRERDFTRGKASHYITAGIIGTALFVFTLVLIVKLILYFAGA